MPLRWGRLIAAVLAAEVIPILILVLAVALFGPRDATQASAYAARLGRWIGPVAGALAVFVLAWWAARPTARSAVVHGLLVGCLAAALDLGILVASGTAFEWLFAVSNAGRVLAGVAGGLVATRGLRPG